MVAKFFTTPEVEAKRGTEKLCTQKQNQNRRGKKKKARAEKKFIAKPRLQRSSQHPKQEGQKNKQGLRRTLQPITTPEADLLHSSSLHPKLEGQKNKQGQRITLQPKAAKSLTLQPKAAKNLI